MAKQPKRLTRKEKIALGKAKPEPKTRIAVIGNNVMAAQLAAALAANPDVIVESNYREPEAPLTPPDKERPGRHFFGMKGKDNGED